MINADETKFTSPTVSRRRVLQALGAATLPATGALAQPIRDTDAPAITWSRTYAPSAGRDSNSHVLTRTIVALDNGFMLAGVAGGIGSRGWITSVDTAGRERWQQTLGVKTSYFVDGAPAPDGGAVLAGVTNEPPTSTSEGYSDPWLVRMTTDGDVDWMRTYQAEKAGGTANAIVRLSDGYAVAGSVVDSSHEQPWVAAVSKRGTVKWHWHPAPTNRKGQATGIAAIGNEIVVAGSDSPATADDYGRTEDAWIARFTRNGEVVWRRQFAGEHGDRFGALAPHTGDGVVGLGRRSFSRTDDGVGWLVALDATGETRWQRTYPQETYNWLRSIVPVGDGYILIGTRELVDSTTRGAWGVRVGSNGRPLWKATYTDGAYTRGFDALPTSDGGLLIGGDHSDDTRSMPRAWLAKIGGNVSESTGQQSGDISLPTAPQWTEPFLAGVGLGAILGGAAMHLRDHS
ncbi:hypothetical protein [Halocatena marina]|uniref:hypothetical protein n=1 Tax=Halocatena marina TaxID=2934937 RepID=UPI00200ED8D2|nr:hypothetical protein [Halocatena marina]